MATNSRTIVLLLALSGLIPSLGCTEYGLQALNGMPEGMHLDSYRDCTEVIGSRYGYEDHTFGVVMIYSGCATTDYQAYLLIEHEFEEMDMQWTTAEYTTSNGDVLSVDAIYYSLDMWYNPVDIELQVIPYQGSTAFGIHEFWLGCQDDNNSSCPVNYVGAVGPDDLI